MRQAGRFLPEYRALREKNKDFLVFCYSPELAAEATLQPIQRFGMDAAIIFSDILVIPHALGVDVRFEEGIGPILVPTRRAEEVAALSAARLAEKLAPVYEALKLTKKLLPKDKTLIGFCGAPWTLACYMVEGKSSKDFAVVKKLAAENRPLFSQLIKLLTEAVAEHACHQIKAGAEVIQLFDSWAGVLNQAEFEEWVIAPAKHIVAAIKKRHPEIPIIGFPRQAGAKFLAYAEETGVNAVSVDLSAPLPWIKENLQPKTVVQGCLDQNLLADNKTAMLAQAAEIISELGDKAFVFNLAHGILPATPIDHMQALCDYLKNL